MREPTACTLDDIVTTLLKMPTRSRCRSRLIAISGIDGSGKGYLLALLSQKLMDAALRVAVISADGWLNLPHIRFATDDPGRHFYTYGFRFEEMFGSLIDPLVRTGSVRLVTARKRLQNRIARFCAFDDIDIVLLEGIFLLKQEHRGRYDFRLWIECSFETALKPALARSQARIATSRDHSCLRKDLLPGRTFAP